MPFIAHRDGETVIPEQVDDGEDVYCRACLERMRARGPFTDGTARHFYHVDRDRVGGGCGEGGSGESDTHLKWKSLAVSALGQQYDGDYRVCAPEVPLDVSETATEVDERRADALVEFHDENRFYGNGIIVEVQHLNVSKDIRGTTHDYLELGYSVYWATEDDFDGDRFLVDRMETAFNEDRRSAFSVYRSEPPALDTPEPLSVSEDDNVVYTTANPIPECDHEFVPIRTFARRMCVACGLEAELCMYDEELEMLTPRRTENSSGRDWVLAADLRTVDSDVEVKEIEEYGESPDCNHWWERPNDIYHSDKHRCGYCEATLIIGSGRIVLNHE
ncbi:hypothetical protein [Halomontanus rarus]|uniref:hypothetical protein n=1 Tax=Halomontanus rarus TaxID=3034020 RepID=UPI00307B7BB2